MTIAHDEFVRLLANGEGETIEFKERIREPRLLARLIAAFANSRGGVIVVGIRKPQDVVGTEPNELLRIYEAATRRLRPSPHTQIEFIERQGRQVGVVQVSKASDLILSDDGALMRVGATVRPMEPQRIAAALANLPQLPPSERQALAAGIADITVQIEQLRQEVGRANSFRSQLMNYLVGELSVLF